MTSSSKAMSLHSLTRNSSITDKPRDALSTMLWRGGPIKHALPVWVTCRIWPLLVRWYERTYGHPPENWASPSRRLSRSLEVIGAETDRSGSYDFLLTSHSNRRPTFYRFQDIARYLPIIANFSEPTFVVMPPTPIGGGIKRCFCLTSDVCLTSVAYVEPKSRTERPRKTKIGTEVVHVTRDSDTTFRVKRSKVKVTRPL